MSELRLQYSLEHFSTPSFQVLVCLHFKSLPLNLTVNSNQGIRGRIGIQPVYGLLQQNMEKLTLPELRITNAKSGYFFSLYSHQEMKTTYIQLSQLSERLPRTTSFAVSASLPSSSSGIWTRHSNTLLSPRVMEDSFRLAFPRATSTSRLARPSYDGAISVCEVVE